MAAIGDGAHERVVIKASYEVLDMRALTTTALLPASTQLPATRNAAPTARRARGWRIFARRSQPSLFQRCLAVHMASAGTLSALR
jgi:hypothetical protein